eukprot:5158657-Prorocentrum_lima.AAC.1
MHLTAHELRLLGDFVRQRLAAIDGASAASGVSSILPPAQTPSQGAQADASGNMAQQAAVPAPAKSARNSRIP